MEELAINGGPKTRTAPFPSVGNSTGRDLGEEEIELLTQVIRSGALGRHQGTMVKRFEEEFAKMYGVKYAVATTSGTASLHTAVAALNLDPGDEIITTSITDMGTVIAILMQNCCPVIADVDPKTVNISPKSIEENISEKTKAIIPVHLFGRPCDMDEILKIAAKYNLRVIEDCSQAHLAEYKGKKVGTIGDIGCFSLQQSKQITTGDGGVVITNDDELGKRATMFADKFFDRYGESGERRALALGINYRMTELQGAVAVAQLAKAESILARRRNSAQVLTEELETVPGIELVPLPEGCKHSYWIYSFTIDQDLLGVTTAEFLKALRAEGIPFRSGYAGGIITKHPVIRDRITYGSTHCPYDCPRARKYKDPESLPGADWATENVCVMSWNEGITEEDARDIARGIRKVAEYYLAKKQGKSGA